MNVRRWVAVAVIVLAGCSHGSGRTASTAWNGEGTRVDAEYVCRQYLHGPYVSAVQTTVGAVRDTNIGPRFPKLTDSDEAVWCWTGKPGAYNVYALTTAGETYTVATGVRVSKDRAYGPPTVP